MQGEGAGRARAHGVDAARRLFPAWLLQCTTVSVGPRSMLVSSFSILGSMAALPLSLVVVVVVVVMLPSRKLEHGAADVRLADILACGLTPE